MSDTERYGLSRYQLERAYAEWNRTDYPDSDPDARHRRYDAFLAKLRIYGKLHDDLAAVAVDAEARTGPEKRTYLCLIDTVLKAKPVQSSQLPDVEKIVFKVHGRITGTFEAEEGEHVRLVEIGSDTLIPDKGAWYIYKPHWLLSRRF